MTTRLVYCMDASSLIESRCAYAHDVFPGVWKQIDALVAEERMIAPYEVLEELKRQDDQRLWKGDRKKIFCRLDQEQTRKVGEIVARFPRLIDPTKETPDADPFVIALALARKEDTTQDNLYENRQYVVVSQETPSGPGGKPKIPNVCQAYGLECVALVELFRREGWTFVLSEKPRTG